jgi:hypothetical protein
MNLFRSESLDVDTRAPPTPPSHLTDSAIHGLLVEEYSTSLRSVHTTEQDSRITDSKAHTAALSASTIVDSDSSASAQTEHLSGLSGTAILCIILGGIVAVVLLPFLLLFFVKRNKHKNQEKESLGQALEMGGGTDRARKPRQ